MRFSNYELDLSKRIVLKSNPESEFYGKEHDADTFYDPERKT